MVVNTDSADRTTFIHHPGRLKVLLRKRRDGAGRRGGWMAGEGWSLGRKREKLSGNTSVYVWICPSFHDSSLCCCAGLYDDIHTHVRYIHKHMLSYLHTHTHKHTQILCWEE